MKVSIALRLLTFSLLALILVSVVTAIAATNTVPPTRVKLYGNSIAINDIKPSACAGISPTNLVSGSGVLTGTEGNDLILAGSGDDVIDGLGGDDCIVGGGATDICIGGAGADVFVTCESENQ